VQVEGRGDMAYDRGTYSWTGNIPSRTEPLSEVGKYLAIARREAAGSWLWTNEIWNSGAPTPV
jgi:ketosteroid isomerase-like protein